MRKTSVIISFYKRIDYLKLLLAGFTNQSFQDFEIIIADDGSPIEIINELEKLAQSSSLNISLIWHEDKGFRKNKILNKAITFSSSDHLIFIDGDCIPHSEFVKEHYSSKQKGVCFTGRRVNLSKKISESLSEEKIKQHFLEKKFYHQVVDGLLGKSYDVEKGFYFSNNFMRQFLNKKKRGILGCNFSIHKNDLLAINGFDERYEAPSIGEDSDVQYRLELNGVEIKSLNNIAVQYHLHHKLQERNEINLRLFEDVKKSALAFTPFGINR